MALAPPGNERNKAETELADGLAPKAALRSDRTAATASGRTSSAAPEADNDAGERNSPMARCFTRSKLSDACFNAVPDSPTKSFTRAWPRRMTSPLSTSTTTTSP